MPVALTVKVTSNGPVFDGRGQRIIDQAEDDIREGVAARGQEIVYSATSVFKNPTPYYSTQLRVTNRVDQDVVNDGGVIYGPWLEGVGSRNGASKFKGYKLWRKSTQQLESEVGRIAHRVLLPHIARLNHG